MSEKSLQEIVLSVASSKSGIELPAERKAAVLAQIKNCLEGSSGKDSSALSSSAGSLELLMERRLKRATHCAYDALGVDPSERPDIRFAREDAAGKLNSAGFVPTLRPDEDYLLTEEPPSILYTNQGGAEEIKRSISAPDGPIGTQVIGSKEAPKTGEVGNLTVVSVGTKLGRVEDAVLRGMPTGQQAKAIQHARGADLVGEELDGIYLVEEFIGRGGFGVVYRATDKGGGISVAIKVPHPNIAMRKKFLRSFREEVQKVAKLDHKNIVRYLFSKPPGEGLYYFVMEYMDGHELSKVLKDEPLLDPKRAGKIMLQILSALKYAHKLPGGNRLLHLDLKPDNIFLIRGAREGEEIVKLIDFGIGQYSNSSGGSEIIESGSSGLRGTDGDGTQVRTITGYSPEGVGQTSVRRAAGGTVLYASPEQCKHLRGDRSIQDLDGRSDLYSFGIVAFKMLTGAYPYESFGILEQSMRAGRTRGDANTQAFSTHLREGQVPEQPRKVRSLNPKVPKKLARLVDRCLALDPEARFADTDEAYEAFERVVNPIPRGLLAAAGTLGLAAIITGFLLNRGNDGELSKSRALEVQTAGAWSAVGDKVLYLTPGSETQLRVQEDLGSPLDDNGLELVVEEDRGDFDAGDRVSDVDCTLLDGNVVSIRVAEDADVFTDSGGPIALPMRLRWGGGEYLSRFTLGFDPAVEWPSHSPAIRLEPKNGSGPQQPLDLSQPDRARRARLDLVSSYALVVELPETLRPYLDRSGGGGLELLIQGKSAGKGEFKEDSFRWSLGRNQLNGDPVALSFIVHERNGRRFPPSDAAADMTLWPREVPVLTQENYPSVRTQAPRLRAASLESPLQEASAQAGPGPQVWMLSAPSNIAAFDTSSLAVELPFDFAASLPIPAALGIYDDEDQLLQEVAWPSGARQIVASVPLVRLVGEDCRELTQRSLVAKLDFGQALIGNIDPVECSFSLGYDPRPAECTSRLQNAGNWIALTGAGFEGPLAVLRSQRELEVDCEGPCLIALDYSQAEGSPFGEPLLRQFEGGGPFALPALPAAALSADGPAELQARLRVWSAKELGGSTSLEDIRVALLSGAAGIREPLFSSAWTYAFAKPLELELELGGRPLQVESIGRTQPLGTLPLAASRLELRLSNACGEPGIAWFADDEEPRPLERSGVGGWSWVPPAEWAEEEVPHRQRSVAFILADDLRSELVLQRLQFQLSYDRPRVELLNPVEGTWPYAKDEGILSVEAMVEDDNGIETIEAVVVIDGVTGSEGDKISLKYDASQSVGNERKYRGEFFKPTWSGKQATITVTTSDPAGELGEASHTCTIAMLRHRFPGAVQPVGSTSALGKMVLFDTRDSGMLGFREPLPDEAAVARDETYKFLRSPAGASVYRSIEPSEYLACASRLSLFEGIKVAPNQVLEPFYMDQHEVTVGQFLAFASSPDYDQRSHWASDRAFSDRRPAARIQEELADVDPGLPIVGVTWFQAHAYASWLGKRLPTWFEWLYAVRGPAWDRHCATLAPLESPSGQQQFAWIAADELLLALPSRPADQYRSPEGLFHLGGNAAEWTCTPYWKWMGRGARYNPDAARVTSASGLSDVPFDNISLDFIAAGGSVAFGRAGYELPGLQDWRAAELMKPNRPSLAPLGVANSAEASDPVVGFRCVLEAETVEARLAGASADGNATGYRVTNL